MLKDLPKDIKLTILNELNNPKDLKSMSEVDKEFNGLSKTVMDIKYPITLKKDQTYYAVAGNISGSEQGMFDLYPKPRKNIPEGEVISCFNESKVVKLFNSYEEAKQYARSIQVLDTTRGNSIAPVYTVGVKCNMPSQKIDKSIFPYSKSSQLLPTQKIANRTQIAICYYEVEPKDCQVRGYEVNNNKVEINTAGGLTQNSTSNPVSRFIHKLMH